MEEVTYHATYKLASDPWGRVHSIAFTEVAKAEDWARKMKGSELYIVGPIQKVTTITEEVA